MLFKPEPEVFAKLPSEKNRTKHFMCVAFKNIEIDVCCVVHKKMVILKQGMQRIRRSFTHTYKLIQFRLQRNIYEP